MDTSNIAKLRILIGDLQEEDFYTYKKLCFLRHSSFCFRGSHSADTLHPSCIWAVQFHPDTC